MPGQFRSNSPGFSPLSIPGCALWLDGTDPLANGAMPANGFALNVWQNKSNNIVTYFQNNPSFKPTYNRNIQNGHPGTLFNSGNLTILNSGSSYLYPVTNAARSFFAVVNPSVADGGIFAYGLATSGQGFSIGVGTGTSQFFADTYSALTNYSTTLTTPNPYAMDYVYTAAGRLDSATETVNGVTQTLSTQAAAFNTASDNPSIGAAEAGATEYYDGYVFEIVYYNITLTASQTAVVRNYLRKKYNV